MISLPKIEKPSFNSPNKCFHHTFFSFFKKNNPEKLEEEQNSSKKIYNLTLNNHFNNPISDNNIATINIGQEKEDNKDKCFLKNINFIHDKNLDDEIIKMEKQKNSDNSFIEAIRKMKIRKTIDSINNQKQFFKEYQNIYDKNIITKNNFFNSKKRASNNNKYRRTNFSNERKRTFINNNLGKRLIKVSLIPKKNCYLSELRNNKSYDKKLMTMINDKIFGGIIALEKDFCSKHSLNEENFEDEVARYQLNQIIKLTNAINDNEYISCIDRIEDLEDNNICEQSIGQLFHINENTFNLNLKKKKRNSFLFEPENFINQDKKNSEGDIKKNKHKSHNKNRYFLFSKKDLDEEKKKKNANRKYEIKIFENFTVNIENIQNITKSNEGRDGAQGINQDSFLEMISIYGNKQFNLFGVMDGQGINGHFVSRHISRFINEYFLSDKIKNIFQKCKNNEQIYKILVQNNYNYIKNLILKCQKSLIENENIDCSYSGSTCLLIFVIGNNLICSNVGDGRAILLEKTELIQLSVDQTLNDPDELKRILSKGGKIREIFTSTGKYKIILDENNNLNINVSRYLGFQNLKNLGIISEPVITEYRLDLRAKFIIMATKGLWKFLSNEKAAIYINRCMNKNNLLDSCRLLEKKVEENWNKSKESKDDFTIITFFFEQK